NVTIPVSTAAGTYYVIAKADADNSNPESNEDNNTAVSGPVTVTSGIDFVLSAFTTPGSMQTGVSTSVPTTITNQGPGAATTVIVSYIKFYLSADSTLDGSDTLLSGSRMINFSLAGGASSSGNTNVTIPVSTAAGTYYVIAKADADNSNPESNEDNNTAVSGPVAVTQ
ncbi:MAG: hypothetical protein HYV24_02460, partial [Deltaproteobacteria bacterium]|nr:hypothetical protein [Deltaproteobacteria bacterium]